MGREPQPHVLGRLVLEPAVRTPERVSALWDRLGRLGAGELATAIDELCSRLVDPEQVIHIDRLEIDAGRVREDHLEADLIEGTRRALAEALLPLIGGDAPSSEQLTPARRLAESVRFLVAHGDLPWWHSAAAPDGLDDLLRAALGQSRDETRRALRLAGQDARARRRLALQLPASTLHEIVRLIEAGHAEFVIDYVAALERKQAAEPFVPATALDFRVATWELVLAYLLVERGSQFNRKRFVSSTVAAMAHHFGLDYGALLFELRRALPRLARATEPLRAILDELWDEQAAEEAPAVRAAAARRDEQLLLVSALLARGLPPAESVPAFDEAVRALRAEPGRLRWVLLAHWHRERVRERLAERPDELLIELVHVVIPAHAAEVVDYGRMLQRAHATRPVIRSDAASFRRARWRFFFDTLVLQHGSAFNTRVFIRATLERLAAHYNTTYDALVPWLWRELGDRPRSPAAHPVVVHLGALYRELRAARGEATRGAARHGPPAGGSPARPPARAQPSLFDLIPPAQRAITRAVVRFVETLPELATGAFGRGLGPGAIAVRVQRIALALLRAERGRPLRPAELLDGLLEQVARESGVPRERVLRWALRRRAQRGSVRDEVRRLVEQVARASGVAVAPARGSSAEHGDGAGEDAVRGLTGFLLRDPPDARPGRGGSALVAWIDRIEHDGTAQVRSRIVELLRDAPARRRVLAAAGNAALARLWAWRRPEQRAAVEEAVEAVEDLARVLASPRHGRALYEAFWQFLWTRRAARARRGAQLIALFVERLARREPRLLALLRSHGAGDRMVARALAGGTRAAASQARAGGRAAAPQQAGRGLAASPGRDRAEAPAGPVFVDAGDEEMLDRWSAAHPEARGAVAEAMAALGRVLFASGYREEERAAIRAAFWRFVWSSGATPPERGAQLLARFFEGLARDAPGLLSLLRGSVAGERLVESALSGGARMRPAAPRGERPPRGPVHGGGASRADEGEGGRRVWRVRTAGVVLVWSLLPRYFERLGLVERDTFRDRAGRERACGLIHFLASGQTEPREPDLVLGKVLCGLDIEEPVPLRVEVDEATRALSESLLAFLLASWKGIGGTTIQGLRGSFLCRDGELSRGEDADRWMLDVERRTYDVLLSSFPWQTSLVKLPWMPQPLFVQWR